MRARDSTDDEGSPMMQDFVKYAAKEVRTGFIRKVYSLLSVQLMLTSGIICFICTRSPEWLLAHQWMLMVSLVGMMFTMFLLMCCRQCLRKYPNNYLVLALITVCMGVSAGFSSAKYPKETVFLAAGSTALIFIAMTIYAWTSSTDFTGMGPYLFAAMICLILFGLIIMVMHAFGMNVDGARTVYNFIGVLLFTFYIVYDTQLIIGEHGGHQHQYGIDEFAFATLSLYLDIINLFLHLLELFGRR